MPNNFINLFDSEYYRSANSGNGSLSEGELYSHFQNYGLDNGLEFSPLVDLDYYRASNSDLAELNNRQAYEHLANYGVSGGREFSNFVDLEFYRENNSDLATLDHKELFEHLQQYGIDEGRSFSPVFDAEYYLNNNPELQELDFTYRDAYEHFVTEGLRNGLDASQYIERDYADNSLSSARTITLDSGEIIFRDSIGNLDRDDYYNLNLNNSNQNLELKVYGLSTDADLDLLNSSGEIIARATSSSNTVESLKIANLKDGEYYIRVFQEIEPTDTNYNLRLSVTPTEGESEITVSKETLSVTDTSTSTTTESEQVSIASNSANNQIVLNQSTPAASTPTPTTTESEQVSTPSNLANNQIVLNQSTPVDETPTPTTIESEQVSTPSNSVIDQVVKLTNEYRIGNGLQPLALNINLSNAAQTHSQDMAYNDFFSHDGSNGSDVSARAESAGYGSSYVGENIAAGHTTAEQVVNGWINSPGHRENILNPNYTEIGIGYYYLENDTGEVNYNSYWTQNFGAVVST